MNLCNQVKGRAVTNEHNLTALSCLIKRDFNVQCVARDWSRIPKHLLERTNTLNLGEKLSGC